MSDPRELWYLALPEKLTPKQVLMILRSALGGDIWQQWQLMSHMLDSWPMLRKCSHEVRAAVSRTRFIIRPYAAHGEDPTPKAIKKADLCQRAIRAFRPNAMSDEKGFEGLVYDLTDAFLGGLSMAEIIWQEIDGELLPRASAWVHPRHYTFTQDGQIAVMTQDYRRSNFPEPNKFLLAQYNSRSGSSLGGGMMRPLAWWWSAVMYNREWMLQFAQTFGQPFRWTTYKSGTPQHEIDKINDMLANIGNANWGNFVEGTVIEFKPAGTLGPQNPHAFLVQEADRACQLLFLGQTATTEGTPGKLGGEDTHESVRRERVEELAAFVANVITEQLLTAVCRLNFGDDDECPACEPDFTEKADPVATANRYKVLIDCGVPILLEEFCEENSLRQPEEGDKVIFNGKIGKLGSTDDVIEVGQPEQELPVNPNEPQPGQAQPQPGVTPKRNGQPANGKPTNGKPVTARSAELDNLDASELFSEAMANDLAEVRMLVKKLIKANDEDFETLLTTVPIKVKRMARKPASNATAVLSDAMTASYFNGATSRRAKLNRRT